MKIPKPEQITISKVSVSSDISHTMALRVSSQRPLATMMTLVAVELSTFDECRLCGFLPSWYPDCGCRLHLVIYYCYICRAKEIAVSLFQIHEDFAAEQIILS